MAVLDSDPKPQNHHRNLPFGQGSEVEVTSDEDGFKGSWYRATIVESSPRSASKKKKPAVVEYKSLVNEDGSTPLKEYVNPEHIRPLPPEDVDSTDQVFEESDVIDAKYRDGWWTGVVRKVLGGSRYRIYFDNPPDVIDFDSADLRVHWDWVNGVWIRPEKQQKPGSMFSSGTIVEVNITERDIHDVWFSAVVIKEYGDGTFLIKYQSSRNGDEAGTVKTIVDSDHIRPLPPCYANRDYDLLEMVDARDGFGWQVGTITQVLAGRTYLVSLKPTNENKTFGHSDIRPHFDWIDGKWISKSEKTMIVSDDEEQLCNARNGKEQLCNALNAKENEGPLSVVELLLRKETPVETSTKETLNDIVTPSTGVKRARDCGEIVVRDQTPDKTGSLSTGKSAKTRQQKDLPRKIKFIKPPFRTPQTSMAVKEKKAVKTASQDISKSADEIILGLEAKEMNSKAVSSWHSYHMQLCSDKRLKLIKDDKNLNASAGYDTTGTNQKKSGVGTRRRKRGRPRKLVTMISKGSETVSYAFAGESTAEVSETDCIINEVDLAIVGVSNDVAMDDDDQPLSTWIGGIQSPTDGLPCSKTSNGLNDTSERHTDSTTQPAATNIKGNGLSDGNQSLPFVKRSPIWKTIESMEIFKVVPQKPHFHPLLECKEEYREGSAVGIMVTFASLFETVASLQFDEPRSAFESILESLMDLSKHGFDISIPQGRLNEMLSIKDKKVKLQSESEGVERLVRKHSEEKQRWNVKIDDIEKKIRELQEELCESKSKMEDEELEAGRWQTILDTMRSYIEGAQNSFRKVATAPWK